MRAAAKRPPPFDASSGPFGLSWSSPHDTLRTLCSSSSASSSKVAAFDMDATLVIPKSGAKFATGRGDWQWWDASVPVELKRLRDEGYKVVVVSNQAGAEAGHTDEEHVMGKLFDICESLGFGVVALLALAKDKWRKPGTHVWNHFIAECNGGVQPTDLFYCGDAAGREAGWDGNKKTKKDFSAR